MKKIYVASSWKNAHLLDPVHDAIGTAGLIPLDFRSNGRWAESSHVGKPDVAKGHCVTAEGIQAFEYDYALMRSSDACFAVLPAGESVCMEVGWFCGQGKPVIVWGEPRTPLDIMWRMVIEADGLLIPRATLAEAVDALVERCGHVSLGH